MPIVYRTVQRQTHGKTQIYTQRYHTRDILAHMVQHHLTILRDHLYTYPTVMDFETRAALASYEEIRNNRNAVSEWHDEYTRLRRDRWIAHLLQHAVTLYQQRATNLDESNSRRITNIGKHLGRLAVILHPQELHPEPATIWYDMCVRPSYLNEKLSLVVRGINYHLASLNADVGEAHAHEWKPHLIQQWMKPLADTVELAIEDACIRQYHTRDQALLNLYQLQWDYPLLSVGDIRTERQMVSTYYMHIGEQYIPICIYDPYALPNAWQEVYNEIVDEARLWHITRRLDKIVASVQNGETKIPDYQKIQIQALIHAPTPAHLLAMEGRPDLLQRLNARLTPDQRQVFRWLYGHANLS